MNISPLSSCPNCSVPQAKQLTQYQSVSDKASTSASVSPVANGLDYLIAGLKNYIATKTGAAVTQPPIIVNPPANGVSPVATFDKHISNLRENIDDRFSDIYTAESKGFLEQAAAPTAVEFAAELAAFEEALPFKEVKIHPNGQLAVVKFPAQYKQAFPTFLKIEDGQWKIDYHTMVGAIGQNQNKEWELRANFEHDYGFAFSDTTSSSVNPTQPPVTVVPPVPTTLSPMSTFSQHISNLRQGIHDWNSDLFTKSTAEMLGGRSVSAGQIANELKAYDTGAGQEEIKMSRDGQLAVVRFPVSLRTSNPVFFRMEDNQWKMDFATMSNEIIFNDLNQWHFKNGLDHDFGFAFEDLGFDENGYPFEY